MTVTVEIVSLTVTVVIVGLSVTVDCNSWYSELL